MKWDNDNFFVANLEQNERRESEKKGRNGQEEGRIKKAAWVHKKLY